MHLPTIAASAQPITLEEMADLLDESESIRQMDEGSLITHFLLHPQKGNIMIVNNSYGETILVKL